MQAPQTGHRCPIERGRFHSPLGGISAHAQHVTVIGHGGDDPITPDAPAVTLTSTHGILGKAGLTWRCRPAEGEAANRGMASGAQIILIPALAAIAGKPSVSLLDRVETPQQIRAMN